MSRRCSVVLLALWLAAIGARAQHTTTAAVGKTLNYKQPVEPQGADNYQYSTFYYNAREVYNLKGYPLGRAAANIEDLRFSPAGAAYAVLTRDKKGHTAVKVMDAWNSTRVVHDFGPTGAQAVAIAFSADSRRFFMALADATLLVFNTQGYAQVASWKLPFVPTQLAASSNGYYLAAAAGSEVAVVNQETGATRQRWQMGGAVNELHFSPDATQLGVATAGTLTVYATRTLQAVAQADDLGAATSFAFHPNGKYVAVVTGPAQLAFVNLIDLTDRTNMTEAEGGLHFVRFVKDGKQQPYLVYNTPRALVYKILKGLQPHYAHLLAEELNARMAEWSRMKPDETAEQYRERVNEDSRLKQARLFEQEIATRLADELVAQAEVTLGSYNPDKGVLAISFSNMNQIYLTVPENEVGSFQQSADLSFEDVVYGLTKDDSFEIIYARVVNRATGKAYVFDNLDRRSLDFLATDDAFVPIELVQQTGLEDVKLQAIKDDVLQQARNENLLTDHTQITVNAQVVPSVDADGRHINNYCVNFDYTVTGNYSVREDFAPGKYKIEQSHAAVSMLNIITRAFEQDFAQYIRPGKKLVVKLTGSADALKINGTIAYDGCYGTFNDEPYYLNGDLATISIAPASGIRKNEQLAFMRAQGVKSYLDSHIHSLQQMATDYRYHVELLEGTGGEFRRISVEFTFIDAFGN